MAGRAGTRGSLQGPTGIRPLIELDEGLASDRHRLADPQARLPDLGEIPESPIRGSLVELASLPAAASR